MLSGCFLQSRPRRAQRQLEKENFAKSERLLQKALAKDSLNPAAYWLLSQLYLDTAYQQHIDTAHLLIRKAQQQAPLENEKDRKRWRKLGLDSAAMALQHARVDSAAFARASRQHTVPAYQYFIDNFADARQLREATERRNALAFAAAEEVGTWQAYHLFFQTYPQARQVAEARERYEQLLFEERTRTGTLQAYRRFMTEYPQTPYRDRLLRNIYRLSTAEHSPQSYYQYIRKYPNSPYNHQALLHLYYLHGQPGTLWQKYPELPRPDSLQALASLADQQLIAVLQAGKWGFLSENGTTVLPIRFDDVHPAYVCKSLDQDFAEVYMDGKSTVLSRTGQVLLEGEYEAVTSIHPSLLRIQREGLQGLMMKNGHWLLQPDYSSIKPLGNDLLLARQDRLMGLLAPNGQWLLLPQADSLSRLKDFVLRMRDNHISIHSREGLIRAAQENQRPTPNFAYLSVRLLADTFLLAVGPDSSWQVLKADLTTLVTGQKNLPLALPGALAIPQPEGDFQVINLRGKEALPGRYEQVYLRMDKLAVKQKGRWSLWQLPGLQPLTRSYDSLQLLHPQVLRLRNSGRDSVLFLTNRLQLPLQSNEQLRILRPQYLPDSLLARRDQYDKVVISSGKNMRIYSLKGKLLMQGRYEDVQAPDAALLILGTDRGTTALADTSGQLRLKANYEGIGNYQKGYLALLKGNRFGVINPYRDILINPQYDAAPRLYNESLFTASRNRRWGLIDTKGKTIIPHRYESICYWSDSVALMQEDDLWQMLHIYTAQPLLNEILEVKWLREANHPKGGIAIIETNAGYGIGSTGGGLLTATDFDDIQNLGTPDSPIFYLERKDREKERYEITYLNDAGKIIFQNTYNRPEWELLLCD